MVASMRIVAVRWFGCCDILQENVVLRAGGRQWAYTAVAWFEMCLMFFDFFCLYPHGQLIPTRQYCRTLAAQGVDPSQTKQTPTAQRCRANRQMCQGMLMKHPQAALLCNTTTNERMHEAQAQNCRRKAAVSLAHLMACEMKECIMQNPCRHAQPSGAALPGALAAAHGSNPGVELTIDGEFEGSGDLVVAVGERGLLHSALLGGQEPCMLLGWGCGRDADDGAHAGCRPLVLAQRLVCKAAARRTSVGCGSPGT